MITEVTPADIPVDGLTARDVIQVHYDSAMGAVLPRGGVPANGIATVIAPVKWRGSGEWAFLRTDLGPFDVWRGETALVVARDVPR